MVDTQTANTVVTTIQERAQELVKTISDAPDPLAATQAIDVIGADARQKMELVSQKTREGLTAAVQSLGNDNAPLPSALMNLRVAMEELNPNSVTKKWWFAWLPKRFKRLAIAKFVSKFETNKQSLDRILDALRDGKDELLREDITLQTQYREIQELQQVLGDWLRVADLALPVLEQKRDAATEPVEVQRYNVAVEKAHRKVRDIRTVEQANSQFLLGIAQTLQTNDLLKDQVESALTVGPSVSANAIKIYRALTVQRQVVQAVKSFQEGIQQTMLSNAQMLNQQTSETIALYNNPVLSLETLEKSRDQLLEAVTKAQKAIADSTSLAKQQISQLAEMTNIIQPQAEALFETRRETAELKASVEEGGVH